MSFTSGSFWIVNVAFFSELIVLITSFPKLCFFSFVAFSLLYFVLISFLGLKLDDKFDDTDESIYEVEL